MGLAESNGSLPPGFWLQSPAGWLPRNGISSETLCSFQASDYHWSPSCHQINSSVETKDV